MTSHQIRRRGSCNVFKKTRGIHCTVWFCCSSGAAEAKGPEPEEAGAGDGQPQLQEPTAGQEGGAAARGASC